jgi:hypothetical protein
MWTNKSLFYKNREVPGWQLASFSGCESGSSILTQCGSGCTFRANHAEPNSFFANIVKFFYIIFFFSQIYIVFILKEK